MSVAGFELLDAFAHAIVGREEDAAQDALLGLDGMGREAVDFGSAGGGGSLAPGFLRVGDGGAAFGNG